VFDGVPRHRFVDAPAAGATDLSRQTIYRIERDPAAAEAVLAAWRI
jgi:DNA-binding XRE family transcriptional regulator